MVVTCTRQLFASSVVQRKLIQAPRGVSLAMARPTFPSSDPIAAVGRTSCLHHYGPKVSLSSMRSFVKVGMERLGEGLACAHEQSRSSD